MLWCVLRRRMERSAQLHNQDGLQVRFRYWKHTDHFVHAEVLTSCLQKQQTELRGVLNMQ